MKQDEFARRRRQLMRMMGRDAIAILPAAAVKRRNGDVEYGYRQDSDFQFLTGFPEPEAVAVLIPHRPHGEYVLFCRERDPARELWDGDRAGQNGAVKQYGADDAFPIGDIDEILPGLLESRSRVCYTMGLNPEFDQRVIGWVNGLRAQAKHGLHTPQEFVALDHLLHDMRLYKSRSELATMRRAASIAVGAHLRAMRRAAPGVMEYEIAAELVHEFNRHRADLAYQPIVGGGPNACVLHYRDNAAELRDGDLLLIDAGCELDCYASDITRTFPVNGRFSPAQRAVYEVVLAAQHAAIAKCVAGNHWNEPHDAAVRVITHGLVKLGILHGRPAKLIKDGAYKEFFMHRTGHWLGLDVHDVGDYKVGDAWRVLEPGMVLTVEPGIYIAPGAHRVAKQFRGIGVRIEDDVAITRGEPEVLSGELVKQPDAIERFLAGAAA
ncbi:MAG TPA: Xaa-Pro aminopeptidase [Steroidobacteraceae bacterium]|nr:Xaa-Pro aminopeptidase [Steroidobacteraceae bacterium]